MNGGRRRASFGVLAAAATLSATSLPGCSSAAVQTFATLADAQRAIEGLAQGWRSTGAWSPAQVLNHAAQSVEYSLRGFPSAKSALFQGTVGRAAFAVFDARGRMSHSLAEPIPGAPALAPADTLAPAIARLQQSLREFEAHTGPLAPHFAYGALDKVQFTRAHLMHLADHWTEFVRS